jgi:aminocarboxymuconate-semialdehyde decarboxylase
VVVDFHVHVLHPEVQRRTGNRTVLGGWGTRTPGGPDSAGRLAGMLDPEHQLADMDRRGVDVHVLSASLIAQYTGWAEPAEQAELEALSNDRIVAWVAAHPDRFVGLATLPLNDTGLALSELNRSRALGFRGVNLPACVGEDYLGAPRFHPIWEAIRDHGLVAFIHPDGARDAWFQQYALWNSVGQPIEEAKALASLILEGVLERCRGVRIVISHGGGYLPHYFGRLDRNVTNMPESVRNISQRPSAYLHDLYYDTCVYDRTILDAVLRRYGADRLVMGSDYPVGEADPVAFVRHVGTERDQAAVLGGTACALLGLARSTGSTG